MSENSDSPPKKRDIRARLGRKSQIPAPPPADASSNEEGVDTPADDVGAIAPPPAFVERPENKSVSPFSAATPEQAGPHQVRIVVDEEALSEHGAEVRKRARKTLMVGSAIAALVGLGIGYLATTVLNKRADYDAVVSDGSAIFQSVSKSADDVAAAKVLVDRAVAAAKMRPGEAPKADYDAIAQLRKLELPFSAKDFHNKRIQAFNQSIVDSLFRYNSLVSELWDAFDNLGQKTLPAPRRHAIDAAAADASATSTTPTGCVPTSGEGGMRCAMVFVDLPHPTADNPKPTKVKVRARRSGRAVEKELYSGQNMGGGQNGFVILTNPEQSRGVLGQQQNAFSEYRKQLGDVSTLMNQTMQAQGKLESEIGQIATLKK